MECRLAGETKVLGENLPQCHFCPSQNPTWPDPGLNSGHRSGKPATNRLSYGVAFPASYITFHCTDHETLHFMAKRDLLYTLKSTQRQNGAKLIYHWV
jgi:hypothetical protein